jgi:ribosomal-protein-alanine N-acetyltransferase
MDDLDCIQQASADHRIPQGTTVPAVYTDDEGRAFIARQWSRQTKGEGLSLAISVSGTAVGLICLMRRQTPRTAEIGYWVVPDERRKGWVTRAISLISTWAIADAGLVRVEARVMPDNEPSLHALRSCRFVTEGVLRRQYYSAGKHHDMVSLSLIAEDLHRH